MRVLRVINDLQVGGVQRMMLRGAGALAALGVETEVACLRARGPLGPEFEARGLRLHDLRFSSRLDPLGLWRLRRLARRGGFDVVHGHMYAANIAVNFALLGRSTPQRVNSYHSITPFSGVGQQAQARRTRRGVAAYVAVSRAVAGALQQAGLPAARTHVIHNGLALPPAAWPLPEREPGAPLQLLWAGRFVRQKQVPFLIEVMAGCRAAGLAVHLTLVGSGPTRAACEGLIIERGLDEFVTLLPVTPDITPHLRACDLFLLASAREGFSNTLLEAAAVGRGMLLSDIEPHREFAEGSGAARFLPALASTDVGHWVAELGEIAADRGQVAAMGAAAFAAVQPYALEATAASYRRLYDELLATPGSR